MKSKLKPPGTERLTLECDRLLSTSAFKFKLCRYTKVMQLRFATHPKVGRCRLTLSNPVLKVLMVSALEATI